MHKHLMVTHYDAGFGSSRFRCFDEIGTYLLNSNIVSKVFGFVIITVRNWIKETSLPKPFKLAATFCCTTQGMLCIRMIDNGYGCLG